MNMLLVVALLAQTQTITVHEAVSVAVAKHPANVLADAHRARGAHLVSEAKASRMPQLSFESSLTRFEEPMVVAPLHGLDPRNPPIFDRTLSQGSVTVGYTLLDPSRRNRIDRVEVLADAADAQAASTRAQTIIETVRAYLHVWAARERNAAQLRRIASIQQESNRASKMVEAGRAARVVQLRADMVSAAANAEAAAVASDLENALDELASLLDVSTQSIAASNIAELRIGIDQVDRAALIEQAKRENPELRRLRLQRDAALADHSVARGTRLPRLQLSGRFVEYASAGSSAQGEWQGGAQVSYAIYTGGGRGAIIDRSSAEVRASEAELALGERRVAESIDRALAALKAARARREVLQVAVTRSEEVARIEQLSLDAGAGVQTDYFSAVAEEFRARAALVDARTAEIMAVVELARLTGVLTEQWLASHVEAVK